MIENSEDLPIEKKYRMLWILIISGVLIINYISIDFYPKPNSIIYWETDESWSLYWAKNSILLGKSSIDKAIGSSFENRYSLKFGEHWIYNVIYGVPLAVAGDFSVEAGRRVSFILGILILILSYIFIKKFTGNENLAFFSILIIASTTSYILGTHCTRYDLLTTLYVTLSVYFVLNIDKLLNRNKMMFFLLGIYTGGTILVSLHSIALIFPSLFLLYLIFIKNKEYNILFSPQTFLLVIGLILPLALSTVFSLAGIGVKPGLFFPQNTGPLNPSKSELIITYGLKNFILIVRDKFIKLIELNSFALVFPVIIFIFLSVKDKFNPDTKERLLYLLIFTTVLFLIFFIVIPTLWGAYTLFLVPVFAITSSYLLNQFNLTKKLNKYLIFFGLIIFLFYANHNLSYVNNKYEKVKLLTAVKDFETIVQNDSLSNNIIFANFQLTNVIEDTEAIKYYTNFIDERKKNYLEILDSLFKAEKINYVLDIAVANQVLYDPDYMQLKDFLGEIADFKIVKQETGIFEDSDRDYHINNSWIITDTLRLYRIYNK